MKKTVSEVSGEYLDRTMLDSLFPKKENPKYVVIDEAGDVPERVWENPGSVSKKKLDSFLEEIADGLV